MRLELSLGAICRFTAVFIALSATSLRAGSGVNNTYLEDSTSGSSVVYGALIQVAGTDETTCAVAGTTLVRDLGTCIETSDNKSACIGLTTKKYESSIAGHQNGCLQTCGQIVDDCIGYTQPANNPEGTLGCILGMQLSMCNENYE